MAIAWVFPGQGSQKVGMAEALLSIEGSRERFAMASELLGRDLLAICQGESGGGDGLDDLNDTRNTQPALFVIESVLADNLQQQGREPALVAGHSLGELVALYSAGVFGLETGLQLMKTRSELMANAGGGAMTAVIGFDRAQLDDLVAATDGVSIANDNSDAQVVISGSPEAVESVSGALKCKRAIPWPSPEPSTPRSWRRRLSASPPSWTTCPSWMPAFRCSATAPPAPAPVRTSSNSA